MNRNIRIQFWILFIVLLANFGAQIVYFYHLYYTPQQPLPSSRSALLMGSVFVFFLLSYFLLMTNRLLGFWAMISYLCVEFLFYLWNIIGSGLRPEYGWFFHLRDRDPVLWSVFAIGYLSFFASGYFLILLFFQRKHLGRS